MLIDRHTTTDHTTRAQRAMPLANDGAIRPRTRVLAAIAAAMLAIGLLPTAAGAQPPPESGVVERFEAPGFAFVIGETSVDGDDIVALALFNFANTEALCSATLAGAGDAQTVTTPSGQFHRQLKDIDVPVLVFDITDDPPASQSAFLFQVCVEGTQTPFADGTARIHDRYTESLARETFEGTFRAHGVVSDGTATWRLLASDRVSGTFADGPTARSQSVRLI